MLFQLVKKDFLIVKKYVLLMVAVCILFPIFLMSRLTEYAGIFPDLLFCSFAVCMDHIRCCRTGGYADDLIWICDQ